MNGEKINIMAKKVNKLVFKNHLEETFTDDVKKIPISPDEAHPVIDFGDLVYGEPEITTQKVKDFNEIQIIEEALQRKIKMWSDQDVNTITTAFTDSYSSPGKIQTVFLDSVDSSYYSNNVSKGEGILEQVKKLNSRYTRPVSDEITINEQKPIEYRCILSNNKRKINNICCPKGFKGSDEEILKLAQSGNSKDVFFVVNIPTTNKKVVEDKKRSIKYKSKKSNTNSISIEEFSKKTNHLFTKKIEIDEYRNFTNIANNSRKDFISNIQINKGLQCKNNIFVCDITNNLIGFTTGKVSPSYIQYVYITDYRSCDKKTAFKKGKLHINNLDIVTNSGIIDKFFRFKIKGYEKSCKLFGQKLSKKKIVGKILSVNEAFLVFEFQISKTGSSEPVLKVLDDRQENYLFFCQEDFEIYMINPDALSETLNSTKNKVEKNRKAIISDDRRLVKLKKGDEVTVLNITPNKTSPKNSTVFIQDSSGFKQSVLLKQLKPYVSNQEKTNKANTTTWIVPTAKISSKKEDPDILPF